MVTRSLLALLLSASLASAAPFSEWITGWGLSSGNQTTSADPDGDGLPNLMEYIIDGCNPAVAELTSKAPRLTLVRRISDDWSNVQMLDPGRTILESDYSRTHYGLRFALRPGISGVGIRPEYSNDLKSWYSGRSAFLTREHIDGTMMLAHLVPVGAGRNFYRATAFLLPDQNAPVTWISLRGDELVAGEPASLFRAVGVPSTTQLTVQDRVVSRAANADVVTDFVWDWDWRGAGEPTIERTTSDPAVITPDPANATRWTYQGNGTATISLRTGAQTISNQVATSTAQFSVVDTILSVLPSSLRGTLQAAIGGQIAGKTANASTLDIYSVQNHAGGNYTRNPTCWAAPYAQALTAISPWNSAGGNQYAGVLISPRHVLFATHYHPGVGTTIRFVAADNTVVTRTITAKESVGSIYFDSPQYSDFTIALLDSDVPASISFARVLPANWRTYLPNIPEEVKNLSTTLKQAAYRVPVFGTNQYEQALVFEWSFAYTMSGGEAGTFGVYAGDAIGNTQSAAFSRWIIGGDSGNPVGLFLNGQFVLLGVWTFPTSGSFTTGCMGMINTAMTTLGGGYQLTPVDLSSFPQY